MWFSKKTNFEAGGLLPSVFVAGSTPPDMEPPSSWDPWPYCDHRPLLDPHTDNQGNVPECAAYATVNLLGGFNWLNGGPADDSEWDPHVLYAQAKLLDGMPGVAGTTGVAVIAAAKKLTWLWDGTKIYFIRNWRQYQWAVCKCRLVLLGLQITDAWNNAKNGQIPSGGTRLGGHMVVGCGYSRGEDVAHVYNQWDKWGYPIEGNYGYADLEREDFERQLMEGYALYRPN